MKKTVIAVLSCALMFVGLTTFAQPKPSAQTISIDRAEIQRFLALEKSAEKIPLQIKKEYKKNEQLDPEELKAVLYEVGFRGERLREAWGTAMKESTGRPRSHNDNPNTGDNSHGLFQINMIGSLGPARLEQYGLDSYEDLFDPLVNAKIAFQMSNGGENWSAWHGITERTQEWMKEFPE
jgi:hypothetical protein